MRAALCYHPDDQVSVRVVGSGGSHRRWACSLCGQVYQAPWGTAVAMTPAVVQRDPAELLPLGMIWLEEVYRPGQRVRTNRGVGEVVAIYGSKASVYFGTYDGKRTETLVPLEELRPEEAS